MAEAPDRLIRKLESIADLSSAERGAIEQLPFHIRSFPKDAAVVREGDRPLECCLLLEGLLCSYNLLPEGTRQISSFFFPGDLPDLQTLHLRTLDHGIIALVPSRAAFMAHTAVHRLLQEHPGLTAVFWRDTLVTAAIYRQWVLNVGGRGAYERIAHLLCEMFVRLRAVGLADDDGFTLPITQNELGDAVGLSAVHVNRVLQKLKADNIIVAQGRRVQIPSWVQLCTAGAFDPNYLHLNPVVDR